MKLENLQKKSIWIALISFLVFLGKTYKLFEVPDNFSSLVDMGLSLCTALGILIDDSKE